MRPRSRPQPHKGEACVGVGVGLGLANKAAGVRCPEAKLDLVASGGRADGEPRSTARATSVVVPFPAARLGGAAELGRVLPSARSLLTAFALLVVAIGGYFVMRDTAVFAVRTIDVEGAPPGVAVQVRRALRADLGTNLLRIDLDGVRQRVAAVPTVASASFDRAFPHTLRITVVPERPVAVIRQGVSSWVVSARGRVMAALALGARHRLPRIWIARGPLIAVGGTAPAILGDALAAVAPLGALRLGGRVESVRSQDEELTLLMRAGPEIRLGDAGDVQLKLTVARQVLPLVAEGTRYLDVSVPERPVAGSIVRTATPPPVATPPSSAATADGVQTLKSQVEVDGGGSITP